jgi:hypothetical protein
VREDYSPDGDAWNHFTHDQARSRAYRWGEDGIAGVCDERQRLCLALALWNGADPILKERFFGLTNTEGNHGEDAKEYWFYVDSTPTHSYMKCVYKYPQRAFPYTELVHHGRGRGDPEYELLDTGVFDEDRYFDVVVEYAKVAPDDILMRVTAHNRGPEPAPLHLLPTLWFRNGAGMIEGGVARHPELGEWRFEAGAPLLYTDNADGAKAAINDHVVGGAPLERTSGSKCAAHFVLEVDDVAQVRVRLTTSDAPVDFDAVFAQRIEEADAFYAEAIPASLDDDARLVMRQAFAGLLWGKQYYEYDVHRWLGEHGINPWDSVGGTRNESWFHMLAGDVISMPDKWEYPWFAAWERAVHCAPLALVDVDFAKEQVELLLSTRDLHPNGQIPANEWNFSDVNPPVSAWAALHVYERELAIRGEGDRAWLTRVFDRLLTNFTWWVNRKDPDGRNLFQGGFLGLDNIGIFDRSAPLPGGGTLEQADGTARMALYCQWMLQIAIHLVRGDRVYGDMALKFITHFQWIAIAVDPPGERPALWDEQDGFYYDVLRMPDGETIPLKVRSLVGLLPMCATTVFEGKLADAYPVIIQRVEDFLGRFADVVPALRHVLEPNADGRRMLSLVGEDRLRRILPAMLDEDEFLGPYGIRSVSRRHLDQPCEFDWGGERHEVRYTPAESDSAMFGGNSNWRGPVWFPMNVVILRALLELHRYYGDELKVECPTGSGVQMNLFEVATEIGKRLVSTFTRNREGRRPVYGGTAKFQDDPHWRDLVLFYEYFNGDDGAGLGASHQTGWTGVIARLMQIFADFTPARALELGRRGAMKETSR